MRVSHMHVSRERIAGANGYPRVAFQGELGAYGEAAVSQRWHGSAHAVPTRTFAAVLALIAAGGADYGVLPVWNSTIGDIAEAREALDAHADGVDAIHAIDELLVPVRHALIGLPGASLDDVRVIGSHPAALSQCARFFAERPRVTMRAAFDTAGATRELAMLAGGAVPRHAHARGADVASVWYDGVPFASARELAVIASAAAAARYGLEMLAEDVQDEPTNATRFVVVRSRAASRS